MAHKEPELEGGIAPAEPQYRSLSDEEMKKLAIGVTSQQVFGSWMVPKQDESLLPSIFMVMAFLDDIQRKEMERDGIVNLYAWMHEAGPRSINGYPMFFSAHYLNADDSLRLKAKIEQIQAALDAI